MKNSVLEVSEFFNVDESKLPESLPDQKRNSSRYIREEKDKKRNGVWVWGLIILSLLFSNNILYSQTISGPPRLCLGSSASYTCSVTGGTWSSSNPAVATVDAASGNTSGITAGNITLSYSAPGDTITTNVNVDTAITLGPISGANAVCILSSVTLSNGTPGGVWSALNSLASVGSATGIVIGNAIGIDTLVYSLTNSCGISSSIAQIEIRGVVGDIYTFGGNGVATSTGDGGPAYLAGIESPRDLVTDSLGNVYFCDPSANVVRKIGVNGMISLIAGNGSVGNSGDGGLARYATLSSPNGVYVQNNGTIYIANTNYNTIRKIDPVTGKISTICGDAISGTNGYSGDGGPATAAKIYAPLGICTDNSGNIYFADQGNNSVREINVSTGIIQTVCGNGSPGYNGDDIAATASMLQFPRDVKFDISGNLFVTDAGNNRIRKIDGSTGKITTIAGTGVSGHTGDGGAATSATLATPARFAYDGANLLYVSDQSNQSIRQINLASGIISRVAGNATTGFSGDFANAEVCQLRSPAGIAVDHFGNFYIADAGNSRIRVVPSQGSIYNAISGPTRICSATPVTFSTFLSVSGSATFQWQKNGINIGSGTPSYTELTPANGDIFRYIATITPACSSTFNDTSNNITLTVDRTASDITCDNPVCFRTPTLLNDSALHGTWSSTDTSIATIDTAGLLTGIAAGNAIISYSVSNSCGTSNAAITVTLNPTVTMTATAGPGGTIDPNGPVTICIGSVQVFTVTPDSGYHITNVMLDSTSLGPITSYTFSSAGGAYTSTSVVFAPDCAAPVITTCPASIVIRADSSLCSALVTYPEAIVSGTSPTISYSQNSGSVFAVGITTVHVTASNGCGTDSCFFTIAVNDSESPTIMAPPPLNIFADAGFCYARSPLLGSASATDNCGIASLTNDAPANFNIGTTTVTWTATDIHGNSNSATQIVTVLPDSMTIIASSTNVSCFGGSNGSISTIVTGGVGPYAYSWTGGAMGANPTGMAAGTYELTVIDSGCISEAPVSIPVTISQPTAISVSVSAGSIACHGGTTSVTVSGTGGTAPLSGIGTYTVTAGTYTYTVVDANGCSANTTITVSEPDAVVATATSGSIACHGGTTTVVVSGSGGTAPLSGIGTFTVTAGTYTYTVVDANGCSANTTITVSEPDAVVATATSGSIACHGGITTVVISGSGGTSPLSGIGTYTVTAGTYTYTAIDANGCSANTTVTVSGPDAVVATALAGSIACHGGTTTVVVSGSGGTAPLSGIGTYSVTAGTYNYTVTDANGCAANTTINVLQPAAVSASAVAGTIACYGGTTSITVTGAGGTAPLSGIGIYTVTAGAYNYTVTDANGCAATTTDMVSQPAAVSASAVAGAIACHGGTTSVTVTGTGGIAPLAGVGTYTVTAGTYTYTVTDANGCSTRASVSLSDPAALSISGATVVNVACFGASTGSITLSVTGGTTPYSYLWSSGSTGATAGSLTSGVYSVSVTDAHGCLATGSYTITQPVSALSATAVVTNATCHGGTGTITTTVAGGTSVYSYTWSNGATTANLTAVAGSYSVVVTDAHGCTVNAGPYTITQPAGTTLLLTASIGNVSCFGGSDGSVDVSATGGTLPYTYTWATGGSGFVFFDDLLFAPAGNYTVTATDLRGCTAVEIYAVSQPAPLTLTPAITNVSCHGGSNGSINLAVSGGTGPYSYSWSNGCRSSTPTGLAPGSITVSVTDAHGCSASSSYSITQPAAISLSAAVTNVTGCYGASNGSIALSVGGGTPGFSYLWSNGSATLNLSAIVAGTYTVTVTDVNGCTSTGSWTVTQPSGMSLSPVVSNVSCNGRSDGSISCSASGGYAPYSYSWSNGCTYSVASGLTAGCYSVTVSDAHSCARTVSGTVYQPSAITIGGSVSPVSCRGGSDGAVSSSVSGGTSSYAYSWSNGCRTSSPTSLSAGCYSVTVTDAHSCSASSAFTISQPATALTASLTVTPVYAALGGNAYTIYQGIGSQSVTLCGAASGGNPTYRYHWSPATCTTSTFNCTPTSSGTYSLTVTDSNGCSYTCTQAINVEDIRSGHSYWHGSNAINICHYGSNLSIDTSYWSEHYSHGDYLGGCHSSGARTTADENNGPSNITENVTETISVYPNPTDDVVNVTIPVMFKQVSIRISDVTGKTLITQADDENNGLPRSFSLGNFPSGIYFIDIHSNSERWNLKVSRN